MRALKVILSVLVLALSAALAVTYTVDPEGGPEDLAERVAQAFSAWLELDDTIIAETEEDAINVFGYGDAIPFGEDTYSLTVQRQDPTRRVQILLNPATAQPDDANALLHEAGLLLGLPTADAGVMNPALPDEPLALGDTEIEALSNSQAALPEDVNQDGEVNFYDLVEFSRSFGQPGVSLPADINEDGDIDRRDLERLREAYVFNPPSREPPTEEEVSDSDEFDEFFEDTGGIETGGVETGGTETGGFETGGTDFDPSEDTGEPFDGDGLDDTGTDDAGTDDAETGGG